MNIKKYSMGNFIYTKPIPTHVSITDACKILNITEDDLFYIQVMMGRRTDKVKHNKIHKIDKKSFYFAKNFENEKLVSNFDRISTFNDIDLHVNHTYSIEFINEIYKSDIYRTFISNLEIENRRLFYESVARKDMCKKKFKSIDFKQLLMKRYRTFDEFVNNIGESLSILFLFYNIFIKNKEENVKIFERELYQSIEDDLDKLGEYIGVFFKIMHNDDSDKKLCIILDYIYAHNRGYYCQLSINQKEILFLIPHNLTMQKLRPIFYYNFKIAFKHFEIFLRKYHSVNYANYFEEFLKLPVKENGHDTLKNFTCKINSTHENLLKFILEFFGGKLSDDSDICITDEVDCIKDNVKYVFPQYLFDYFNIYRKEKRRIEIKDYFFGQTIEKPYYPFKDDKSKYFYMDEENLPQRKQEYIKRQKTEESKTIFFQ